MIERAGQFGLARCLGAFADGQLLRIKCIRIGWSNIQPSADLAGVTLEEGAQLFFLLVETSRTCGLIIVSRS